MKPGQRAVLLELAELDRLGDEQRLDGWWKAFQVRYYRVTNPLREKSVQLESVKTDLRALAAAGLVDRKPGREALYRINDEGHRLVGEIIEEHTRRQLAEFGIRPNATVAELVDTIASLRAEVADLKKDLENAIRWVAR